MKAGCQEKLREPVNQVFFGFEESVDLSHFLFTKAGVLMPTFFPPAPFRKEHLS